MTTLPDGCGRTALVIAHPGHELRVYGWVERVRPRVFVLTDGSGRSGRSRLGSTTRLLTQAGARLGGIYGRLTDARLYQAILDREFGLFTDIADELAEAMINERFECVAGDAIEGYNPAHDVCRLLINAGVEIARAAGHLLANYDFLVVGDGHPDRRREGLVQVELDEGAFERKLAAARAYSELAGEVDAALAAAQIDSHRVECFRPAGRIARIEDELGEQPPFYELHGERRVAAGHYQRVLRFREHMVPLSVALLRHVAARQEAPSTIKL